MHFVGETTYEIMSSVSDLVRFFCTPDTDIKQRDNKSRYRPPSHLDIDSPVPPRTHESRPFKLSRSLVSIKENL